MKKRKILYLAMGLYILIAVGGIITLLYKKNNHAAQVSADTVIEQSTGALETLEDSGTKASASDADQRETQPETQPEQTTASAEKVFAGYSYTVVGASSVNLRSTPDETRKPITYILEGTTGRVLERGEYYSLVAYKEIKGYVYNGYLDIQEVWETSGE